MRRFFSALFLLLVCANTRLVAQTASSGTREVSIETLNKYGLYDTDRLPPSFHAGRRKAVLDSMQPGSVALFVAGPERTRANDIEYEYHQDANFYYLTGCLEAGSALILSKDGFSYTDANDLLLPAGRTVHELLLVHDRDPAQETWTGRRLGPAGAMEVLKPEDATSIDSLPSILNQALAKANHLYYDSHSGKPAEPVFGDKAASGDSVVRMMLSERYPNITYSSLRKVLSALREVKSPDELRLMRRAISISNVAHNRVIHNARPGWYEYQIQGLAESIFTDSGAEYTAYPCIVGSGPNSTILHYETNRRQTKPGDFIEMDMGAEYHGYAADVTRSFPISGKFTPEQRAIYSLVLEAQDSGIKLCKAGAPFRSAHWAAVRVITRGLLSLGIIRDSADYRKYFMHGTSHYLGLDVHDAGTGGPLKPGNVLTVEPGIYIAEGSPCDKKWWNIGCRIEDDILVTENGPENLSAGSPSTIPALEKLLSRSH